MVTVENAEEYVELMFDFCMHTGIQKQMEAFKGEHTHHNYKKLELTYSSGTIQSNGIIIFIPSTRQNLHSTQNHRSTVSLGHQTVDMFIIISRAETINWINSDELINWFSQWLILNWSIPTQKAIC